MRGTGRTGLLPIATRGETCEYIIVAGKLDPHVTVRGFDKLKKTMDSGANQQDDYGVPILPFIGVVETRVEPGLSPLHTQFDNQGGACTSLFLDSAVAR
ncbi:MAG: hypothetical protein IT307_16870 [Chloroflexi bacterium]|nr:hypothetical protein [Chloroflexota bacterium]